MEPVFGLIGRKLGHSYSPLIHARLGGYPYRLIELEPGAVAGFIAEGKWAGLNVTIPYKETVIPLCAVLSDTARRIGAVNTLWRDAAGRLHGDNTDYYGFAQMLARADIAVAGRKVLLLGSGGTSKTARAVLEDAGAAAVVQVSRTGEVNYDNVYQHGDAAVVVNTTPAGMFPKNGERLLDLDRLPRLESAVDVVYNPERTRFLLDAAARGLKTAGGLAMLVYQGARAAEIFLGAPGAPAAIPAEKVEETLAAARARTRNLVLVGMPGSGKSTIGAALAARLGREFIDTDQLVERDGGRPIPQIIAADGEAFFRGLETAAVAAAGKLSGKVVATGGGAVLRPENRDALRQNATVVYLRRPLAELPTAGRPLSQGGEALARLFHEREPLYQKVADFSVDNGAGRQVEEVVEEILRRSGMGESELMRMAR